MAMRLRTLIRVAFALIGCGGLARADEIAEPAPPATAAELLAQLPPELAAALVDPLTVAKRPLFAAGEQLRFRIGWSMFTVAHAEMRVETLPFGGGAESAVRIDLKTRTNSFADTFYKVRNESWSWIAADASHSLEYGAVQQESNRNRDTLVSFDPQQSTAWRHDRIKDEKTAPISVLPGTFDPLGIVFFVRSLSFDVGDVLVIPTTNGREFFFTIVRVTGVTERRFAIGKRRAYILEPDIKDIGGVFRRSPNSKIRFFLSADAQKLLLRMESEVSVGKFWAELTEFRALEP